LVCLDQEKCGNPDMGQKSWENTNRGRFGEFEQGPILHKVTSALLSRNRNPCG
jgi:hypothetical protein